MSEIISLENITMSFSKSGGLLGGSKKTHALKNVDFAIQSGEITVIVGESGCGKTTMGKIITGLLRPSGGKVKYMQKDIYKSNKKDSAAFRSGVQFVQQDSYAALNPANTIYQSMLYPLQKNKKELSQTQLDEYIGELLHLVGLNPPQQFLSKYPHQLSGGQRQRLLIARAISLSPKLIVTDEPVSMIDVSLRISILNLMSQLNKDLGISFVYITHDLATARYIADMGKICVMYLGEIVESGPVQEVLFNPKHPYTQALLAAVPIPNPEIAKNRKALPLKTGEVESFDKSGSGCSFYKRCLYSTAECQVKVNIAQPTPDVQVRCNHLEKVPSLKTTLE